MIKIENNISLKNMNTFGIESIAGTVVTFSEINELTEVVQNKTIDLKTCKVQILGGGSNVLFCSDFEGIIIKPRIEFIKIIGEDADFVFVEAGAGMNWDSLVDFAVERNLGGVENLAGIPGNVGAVPVQNIGAYGAEAKNTVHNVKTFNMETLAQQDFSNSQCRFGYRYSIFKEKQNESLLVTSVTFRFLKNPRINIAYGNIESEIKRGKISKPTINDIKIIIRNIRKQKLPDSEVTGNAGSFFKNTVVTEEFAIKLKKFFPKMPVYPTEEPGYRKLSAAWLIDQSGFKGKIMGNAGISPEHALVLINRGNATGQEIVALADEVCECVNAKFGIRLEPEVKIIS